MVFSGNSYAVLYGEDDRKNFYQVTEPELRDLGLSSAAIVPGRRLEILDGARYLLHSIPSRLCSSEAFLQEKIFATCSSVLISESLVLTVGHCFFPSDCSTHLFIFGLWKTSDSDPVQIVKSSSVYRCNKVLAWKGESLRDDNALEYAIIQLDRPVALPFRPAKIASQFHISKNDPLYMIGYPLGLPMKWAAGYARKESLETNRMIETNLDTYAANSGSPLFNALGELVAIMANGEKDSINKKENSCTLSKRCTDASCAGSYAIKIREILELP